MCRHVVGAFVDVPISVAPSGARPSKNVWRSARTSRAAFSCISNPADVCRQNRVKSPAWTVCGSSQFWTSCVISTSPRPRGGIERISTACRIALSADVQMAVASGTFREFWRCWGARAPAANPTRGQNAAYHPYHSDHSDRGRRALLALQHGLGLLSGRRTRDTADHRPHSRLARICLAGRRRLLSSCPNKNVPRRDCGGVIRFGTTTVSRRSARRYLRQITPARNPSPRARASVASGRS
jgi:hypothetical protein